MMKLVVPMALSLLAACRTTPEDAFREGTVRAPDGVPIVYQVSGRGEPTLFFVHCWCGNRAFWENQIAEFSRDHRVVALDLAGHGASGDGRAHWSIEGYAGDVLAVADELHLSNTILIGHSMGGPVSLATAARMKGRVIGVIAVDTLHDAEFHFDRQHMDTIAASFEKDFAGTMDGAIRSMSRTDGDPKVTTWIIEQTSKARPAVAIALFRDFSNLDFPRLMRSAGVPVRCINAAPYPPSQLETKIATNRKYCDFDADVIEGVGHFLQLEKPAEVNAKLRARFDELAARAKAGR